ncbi:uncharacterized protein LOC110818471 [Carica papaya]|uniref:uncharacterized protein LOC110818471 n=1 Tax=Carica papaya TaxID=3649 RepID=UPI000B8CAB72|nr:uncharacterized protein LOC110818471 [Carica papaya]
MDRTSRGKEKISQKMSIGSDSRHSKSKANSSYAYVPKKHSSNRRDGLLQTGGFCQGEELHDAKGTGFRQDKGFVSHLVRKDDILSSPSQSGSVNVQLNAKMNMRASQTVGLGNGSGLHGELIYKVNDTCLKPEDDADLPHKGRITGQLSQEKNHRKSMGFHDSSNSKQQAEVDPFDICMINKSTFTLKPSLFANNREKRNQIKHSIEGRNGRVLRSGMVLLKKFLSLDDQVNIVKVCRDIGLGAGGFYQPGYRDGGKLHLKMMCLGQNWDPDSGQYGDFRLIDDAKPPSIPLDFLQFVENAIGDSHALIAKNSANVEDILPWMSPNISPDSDSDLDLTSNKARF